MGAAAPQDFKSSSINNLHVVKTLNKGAFAEVYQAIEISTGKPVALKVVSRFAFALASLVKTRQHVCKRDTANEVDH